MNKTYLELACEIVTAMINKGQLYAVAGKDDTWQTKNRKNLHTVGWAVAEMYNEIKNAPEVSKKLKKPVESRSNIKIVK